MKDNRNNNETSFLVFSLATALAFSAASWGCSSKRSRSDEIVQSVSSAYGKQSSAAAESADKTTPFSDTEMFDYLERSCGSCHGPDGGYRSNWDMPAKDKMSASSLESVAGITRAFQSIANKYDGNEGASPSAMPLGVDFNANPKAKQDSARALKWFAERLPGVVQDAASLYPRDEKTGESAVKTSDVKVAINYRCKQVRNGRSYLTKLTASLFNRNPTDAEFQLLGSEVDKPVSKEKRVELSSKILPKNGTPDAWIAEFEEKGLKKFAHKIADIPNIVQADIDPVALRTQIQNDLKDEFYQLLKTYYKSKSYKDILLLDKVMVTVRTAPLYEGCTFTGNTTTPPTDWSECTLSPERGNYFGSVSYLRAKPSSFLENGNNYGRAGSIFLVASGEALLAQTNGPVGTDVRGLPECLTNSTKDARARVNETAKAGEDEPLSGPYGSLTVPGFGNVCQGCHVRRGLAAGSKVYRPFGKFGERITAATLDGACGNANGVNCNFPTANAYSGDLRMATYRDKRNYDEASKRFISAAAAQKARGTELDKNSPVTVALLKQFLAETTDGKGSCIPVDAKTIKPVLTVKDLAEFVVGGDGNVARGLARMIPKAIAGTQLTNQEVMMAINQASSTSTPAPGMLSNMVAAYLATETFACQEE